MRAILARDLLRLTELRLLRETAAETLAILSVLTLGAILRIPSRLCVLLRSSLAILTRLSVIGSLTAAAKDVIYTAEPRAA